jgi:transposase
MASNFIACDRDQPFLMPPSLLDWVPEEHLVWTILGAVEEMDLGAFYAAYRADGHGRPAYEPSMMVALLLYAYARGNRSSRGIERECMDDVAYRVIATNLVPDHSTIADFRKRHETALADLFSEVLSVCREAGLVTVGVIAVDGTKVHANASHHNNVDFERLARAILAEADRIDGEEDERYGEKRGDELPEQLQTAEGRRAALRDARQRLERDRERVELDAGGQEDGDGEPAAGGGGPTGENGPLTVELEFDAAAIVSRVKGREGWLHDARQQVNEHRKQTAWPVPRSRPERLLEAERRMQETLAAQRAGNDAYEDYRANGRMKDGRRFGGPPKPYEPPREPDGMINATDPDSRNMQTAKGWVQGYNAQAAVNEDQIIVAAEITVESPDFGHLEAIVEAAEAELEKAGVTDKPEVLLADAGYWHQQQMEKIVSRGTNVLIPPDADKSKGPRRGWEGGPYAFMRAVLASERGGELYRKRQVMIEPVFGNVKYNRKIDMFLRRGRSAVRSEWRLVTATHNLLKLHKHQIATAGG